MLPHFFFMPPHAKPFEARLDQKRGDAFSSRVRIRFCENDEYAGHAAVRDPRFRAVQLVVTHI